MNRTIWPWLIALILCILAVPWASDKPDALQFLLGLSGGEGNVRKALVGATITVLAVIILAKVASRKKNR